VGGVRRSKKMTHKQVKRHWEGSDGRSLKKALAETKCSRKDPKQLLQAEEGTHRTAPLSGRKKGGRKILLRGRTLKKVSFVGGGFAKDPTADLLRPGGVLLR